jgi:CheY-like chemotaxis protein
MSMSKPAHRRTILMADDDVEDCLLVRDALLESGRDCDLRFVRDGEELFDYLRHEGEYIDGRDLPWPDLILIDLKMPRKDGREAIRDLKTDPRFRQIPVVALTTSSASDDVAFSYSIGVNCYITKPTTFRELVDVLDALGKFWFDVVELPAKGSHGGKAN